MRSSGPAASRIASTQRRSRNVFADDEREVLPHLRDRGSPPRTRPPRARAATSASRSSSNAPHIPSSSAGCSSPTQPSRVRADLPGWRNGSAARSYDGSTLSAAYSCSTAHFASASPPSTMPATCQRSSGSASPARYVRAISNSATSELPTARLCRAASTRLPTSEVRSAAASVESGSGKRSSPSATNVDV